MFFYNPNSGDGFVEVAYSLGLDFIDDGRAFVPVDVDGDGDLDLPMASLQRFRLMENVLPRADRHFARLRLKATRSQHHALGADRQLFAVGCRVRGFPAERMSDGMRRYLDWQNSLLSPAELARDRFVESPVLHPSLMMRTAPLRSSS